MVEPVETEWFGFYKPGQAEEVQKLQQSELYQQVYILTIDLYVSNEYDRSMHILIRYL